MDGQEERWNLYEVVERWGMMEFADGERKMGYVVLANEKTILNPEPFGDGLEPYESPFSNNVMPFAHLAYDRLPHSFWSMSFIDPIASQQVELNDLEAMKKSNYIRRNNPPLLIDKNAEVDLATTKWLAGMPWLVNGITNVKSMDLPDLSIAIEGQQAMIRRTMMNVTGSTDILMAVSEGGQKGGKVSHNVQSASHAQLLQESIKTRFKPQAMQIDKYIERIGKLLINLWQDKRYWVGMKGNKVALALSDEEGNNTLLDINQGSLQGELDFIVTSASSIAKSEAASVTQDVNLLQLFAQDPSLDLTDLKRDIFEKSGHDWNHIQKPKASNLPALTDKLQQLVALTQEPNFKQAPRVEQLKVMQQINNLKTQIQQLQQQNPQGGGTGQQQGQQAMGNQQLQAGATQ